MATFRIAGVAFSQFCCGLFFEPLAALCFLPRPNGTRLDKVPAPPWTKNLRPAQNALLFDHEDSHLAKKANKNAQV